MVRNDSSVIRRGTKMRKDKLKNRKKKGLRCMLLCAAAVGCLSWNTLSAEAATGTVTSESARIRSAADSEGEVLAGVKKNDTVDVISKTEGADGNTWYQVHVDGSRKGYIRSDLVSVNGDVPSSAAAETTNLSASTENLESQTTETSATVTESSASSGTVTKASVNVRKGPATTDAIVGSVKRDNVVTITGETIGGDGKKWYQVSFSSGGKDITGFILSDLIGVTEKAPEEEQPEETPETEGAEEGGGDEISRAISSKILPADADISNYVIDENTLADMEEGRYYLLYMTGEDGSKFYYLYDTQEHIYQRADSFNTGAVEEETKSSGGFGTTAKIIVIILGVVVVILITIIVLLALKLKRNDWEEDDDDDDEDDYDEDDEEDEDEDGRVNSRAWRPRNFLRTSGEDDDEEDEDDDEEDELPRRPVRRTAPARSAASERRPVAEGRRRPVAPEGAEAPRRRPAAPGSAEAPRRRPAAQEGVEAPRRRPAAQGPAEAPRRRPVAEGPAEAPRRRPMPEEGVEAPRRRPAAPEGTRRPAAQGRSEAPRKRPAPASQGSSEAPVRRSGTQEAGEAPRRKPAPQRKSFYEEDDEFEFEFLNMDGKDDL